MISHILYLIILTSIFLLIKLFYSKKMGTPHSKTNNNKKDIPTAEAHLPTTPISTPKTKILDWDPRSPSENVVRTPIEIGIKSKTDSSIIGIIKSSGNDEQVMLDPRSPSTEIVRTPIILGDGAPKPRNKKLDLVRQQLTNFSPMKPHGTEIYPVRRQGPILLGVSPVTKKVNQEKRKSYVGMLETDLDFVETDLDKVKSNNTSSNKNHVGELFNQSNNETVSSDVKTAQLSDAIIEEEKCDAVNEDGSCDAIIEDRRDTVIEEDRSDAIIEEKCYEPKEKLIKTNSFETVTDEQKLTDTIINSIDFKTEDLTGAALLIQDEQLLTNITPTEEQIEDIVFDREAFISPIKETLERMCQIDKEIKDVIAIVQTPIEAIDDEYLSNAFDKKVNNLIYEDQEIINIPKNVKQQNSGGNRTPLSEKNVNQNSKKSVSKLKVHDKPLNKRDYSVSKIPVFKEKKAKTKITQQCENTPPRQMTETKIKKTQWDADKTMII